MSFGMEHRGAWYVQMIGRYLLVLVSAALLTNPYWTCKATNSCQPGWEEAPYYKRETSGLFVACVGRMLRPLTEPYVHACGWVAVGYYWSS